MSALGLHWTVGSCWSEEYWENPGERTRDLLKCSQIYLSRERFLGVCLERLAASALFLPLGSSQLRGGDAETTPELLKLVSIQFWRSREGEPDTSLVPQEVALEPRL